MGKTETWPREKLTRLKATGREDDGWVRRRREEVATGSASRHGEASHVAAEAVEVRRNGSGCPWRRAFGKRGLAPRATSRCGLVVEARRASAETSVKRG